MAFEHSLLGYSVVFSLDLPTSRAQNFSRAQVQASNLFYVFCGKVSERPRA